MDKVDAVNPGIGTPASGIRESADRRLSQLKVLARLFAHEIELAGGDKNVTLEADLAHHMLSTLELYIEDLDLAGGRRSARLEVEKKPPVTRLS